MPIRLLQVASHQLKPSPAVAQGLTLILTQTMAALILGVATPFLVLGGCAAYALKRETRPEFPPRRTEPQIIDVPPRRFRNAAW